MTPAIYTGEVMHQRFAPKRHRLSYQIFQVLLDLDRLEPTRLLSVNRFNLFSFHERDHGPDQAEHTRPLRDRMAGMLREKGLYADGDRLFLLTMPRVLGFVFNPISLYFLCDNTRVKAVVYEVNNTFGDRHSYVLPVEVPGQKVIEQHTPKRLHVSPFMDMDMAYDFALNTPRETFNLRIRLSKVLAEGGAQDMLLATFAARREPLTDAVLWRHFWALPLMTLKVVWGIHWEALKIWLKGIGLRPKPPTHSSSVSVG